MPLAAPLRETVNTLTYLCHHFCQDVYCEAFDLYRALFCWVLSFSADSCARRQQHGGGVCGRETGGGGAWDDGAAGDKHDL